MGRKPSYIIVRGDKAFIHLDMKRWWHRNLWDCARWLGFHILVDELWHFTWWNAPVFKGRENVKRVTVYKNRIPVAGYISHG